MRSTVDFRASLMNCGMDHVRRPIEEPNRSRFLLLYFTVVIYEKEVLGLDELEVNTLRQVVNIYNPVYHNMTKVITQGLTQKKSGLIGSCREPSDAIWVIIVIILTRTVI